MSLNSTSLVGWTPESGGRGTWSIIWSCLSTIFLAVWVTWHQDMDLAMDRLEWYAISAVQCLVIICAPWMLVRYASGDLQDTIMVRKALGRLHIEGSLAQCHYMAMGGYSAAIPDVMTDNEGQHRVSTKAVTKKLFSEQILWLLENKIVDWPKNDAQHETKYVLERPCMLKTMDVEARSNASLIARLIVVLQCTWFLVQSILRGVHGLPLSTLEVHTISYLMCSLIAYMLWWKKPYSVRSNSWLEIRHLLSAEQWIQFKQVKQDTFISHKKDDNFDWNYNLSMILIIADGAIYFIAWNSAFPSTTEQLLWRISAIVLVTAPTISVLPYAIIHIAKKYMSKRLVDLVIVNLGKTDGYFALVLLATKLCLMVESFIGLRSSPPGIYETWVFGNWVFSVL